MFGPTSPFLMVFVGVLAVGSLVLAFRYSRLALRIPLAIVALLMPFVLGITAVNSYYEYYRDWSSLFRGLAGTPAPGIDALKRPPTDVPTVPIKKLQRDDALTAKPGEMLKMQFPGATSGISGRSGYLYVPPEYGDPRFTDVHIPIVVLLHGTPGIPADWINGLHVKEAMDNLRAQHVVGPMILVLPDSNGSPSNHQECVNGVNGTADDTFITTDVLQDVRETLKIGTTGANIGLMGFSSGGYCAANLAIRHAPDFAAAASLDGYYTPSPMYYRDLFGTNTELANANNPTRNVAALTNVSAPAFFVSSGTGDKAVLQGSRDFVKAIPGSHLVTAVEPNDRHTFAAWDAVFPKALSWMWNQVSTPDQRVFYTPVQDSSLASTFAAAKG